jgi:membrane protein required for colicin V production
VTLFDYLVIFVLAASVIISLMRGMIREILSLASWVVAFVVANAYAAALLAFIALFIGVRILMGLLAMALSALVDAGGLSVIDRGLGGLFGLCRGLVIVLAAVILCGMTSLPQQAFWKNALLSPLAETGARAVKPFLPAAMAQHVNF